MTGLSETIKTHGFEQFGFVKLGRPLSFDIYRQWIEEGRHGDMAYLKRHLDIKETPQKLAPRARSAIVVTARYMPAPQTKGQFSPRIALYAKGSDYHRWFGEQLERLATKLSSQFTGEEFLCYTDSAPISERDLAARAGLGWIGKNGCLISRQAGSLFFIGEIFTSLLLSENAPPPDHCGTCDRCIRACPTDAILPNRTIESRRCIAYWTIEAKTSPPLELRSKINDWFFGCDICQTVCPWNEKVFGKTQMQDQSQALLP